MSEPSESSRPTPPGRPDLPLDSADGDRSGEPIPDERTRNLLVPMRTELGAETDSAVEITERYWLVRPFAFAVVLRDTRTDEHSYHVVEPDLDEHEHYVYRELERELREHLVHRVAPGEDDHEREAMLERQARRVIDELPGLDVPEPSFQQICYYLRRNLVHFGKVDPLMSDPRLEEVSCNAPESPVFVYHRDYEDLATNIEYEAGELRSFIKTLAQRSGKDISTAKPMQGTALPDGSRIQLTLDEVAPRGENFTIRKFREVPFTPVDLVQLGTFTVDQLAYLWTCIDAGLSGIVAGGTASGKTTALNALSMFLPPKSKVVSIEDTRELQIPQENWVASLTREPMTGDADETGIDMFDLLRGALRQRPEYILVGEVRGEEARDMFEAMSTGHTTYSTFHADRVEAVLNRLQGPRMGVEKELISELGFLCFQAQVGSESERRNTEIAEVLDIESGRLKTRTVFEWSEPDDTIEQVNRSAHMVTLRQEQPAIDDRTDRRRELLAYLVAEDISGYEAVSAAVRAFERSPDRVIEQVRAGALDAETLHHIEAGDDGGE
ncbi:ATPase, T2SS/T4P/T4SS family [Halosegnis longus]|uniref:ATPase, T2SS/T4P/T4SS family n=1 Tax=Halosegnis longus TaxID=2216012 RepID=UPI0013562C8B|nr:type II/IV secretion system ATPase subunit [Salella cibi]